MASRLDRRQLLKIFGAGAIATGAAVTLGPTVALASDSIVGSWRIRIHQSGHTTQGVASFAPGGMMATTDSNSPSTGLGVWDEDHGKFEFRFITFDFSNGPPGVTVVITGKGTEKANTVAGTFTVMVGGHTVGTGTFDGTRMAV